MTVGQQIEQLAIQMGGQRLGLQQLTLQLWEMRQERQYYDPRWAEWPIELWCAADQFELWKAHPDVQELWGPLGVVWRDSPVVGQWYELCLPSCGAVRFIRSEQLRSGTLLAIQLDDVYPDGLGNPRLHRAWRGCGVGAK